MPRPQLWVLAGGNGAGKSTFYRLALAPKGVRFVNADEIARDLGTGDPVRVSYEAARIAETIRRALLRDRRSFCCETVFSHPSKIDFIAEARALGYEVNLVIVHLGRPELNQLRVEQRVSEGGHAVPAEKILARIPRTLGNLKKALPLCDRIDIFENSSYENPFRRVATISSGKREILMEPLPHWARELIADYMP